MRWEKRGRIFSAEGQYPWLAHHASMPIALPVGPDVLRIYFGPRDAEGRSHVAFIDVATADPSRVLHVHDRPALSPGSRGSFDDSGAMPSCIIADSGALLLYYIGWNRGVTTPYRTAIGLAVSHDGGVTFERVFDGPILDRSLHDPFFCTSPFVLREDGRWRMWYASATGWLDVGGKPEASYQVRYAESANGHLWSPSGLTCLPYVFDGETNVRPSVLHENGLYRMWYCVRSNAGYRTDKARSYRMGYAESADGLDWRRLDDLVGIGRSEQGWDSEMIAYPHVFACRGAKYMLYCGNGFGMSGFGYAVLAEDDRSGDADSHA